MSNYNTSDIERFTEIFKALSNSNRLRILVRLVSRDGTVPTCYTDAGIRKCIGELGKDLDIVPSTVSHHSKELHRVGLIRMKRCGHNVECWVDHETLASVNSFLSQRALPDPSDNCEHI